MTTIYATYYDHIERAGFNPQLVIKNWNSCDKRVICCAQGQVDILKAMNLDADIIDIGLGISTPSDIAKAINISMKVCFDTGADYVVWVFGDLYVTDKGDKFMAESISNNACGSIPSMGVSLYTIMYAHADQVVINSRDNRPLRDPIADGEALLVRPIPLTSDLSLILDIGYIGTPQYYTKMRNHVHIWPDPYKAKWAKAYESGHIAEAVRAAYKSIHRWRGAPLVPMDYETNKELIERLNLQEDFAFCNKILKEFA